MPQYYNGMPQYSGPSYSYQPYQPMQYPASPMTAPSYSGTPQTTMQPQQMQQPQMQASPSLVGRIISSEDQQTPGEVPFDGTPAYFPVGDGSVILAKIQQDNGLIRTIRYVREEDKPVQPQSNPPQQDEIMKKLEALESTMDTKISQLTDLLTK